MPIVSVAHAADVAYPDDLSHAPDSTFPERLFDDESIGTNRVYGLVREALIAAQLDPAGVGTSSWNPLGQWIAPSSNVFVLPNLVVERRPSEPLLDFQGKCTQAPTLRAVLDYVIRATGDAQRVRFGNASLQSCDYPSVSQQAGMEALRKFYLQRTGADLGPHDLRGVVTRWQHGALLDRREQNLDDVVHIDLGADSLLDVFYADGADAGFRVSDYDHREILDYHGPGRHVYAVHRALLEADTIVSVPTLKTHEKVGLTCAVKGTVGAIARKECLAHHRRGAPSAHGDEFPAATFTRNLASRVADRVSVLGMGAGANAFRVMGKGLYKILRAGRGGIMAGAWYGNDTAWRMAVDIARILRFADRSGVLRDTPQRQHIAFIDGIVGGEAEGPVYPRGRHDGVVLFSPDPVEADRAAALLMGFAPDRIPIIAGTAAAMRYSLTSDSNDSVRYVYNGAATDAAALSQVLDRPFTPAKGWVGRIALAS